MTEINCPFYGRSMYCSGRVVHNRPFVLITAEDNQCALVTAERAPCELEIRNEDIDWSQCGKVRDLVVG
jgi:hypothetical protein